MLNIKSLGILKDNYLLLTLYINFTFSFTFHYKTIKVVLNFFLVFVINYLSYK